MAAAINSRRRQSGGGVALRWRRLAWPARDSAAKTESRLGAESKIYSACGIKLVAM